MAGSSRSSVSLADLLPAIRPAAETLIRHMTQNASLQKARLLCRAFRDFIDQHVTELAVRVTPEDLRRRADGKIPSLERWPHCSSLELWLERSNIDDLSGVYDSDEDEERMEEPVEHLDAVALATLPLLGLSVTARRRITKLRITTQGYFLISGMDALVPSLAALLPNLEELDLGEVYDMLYEQDVLQLMYDSLATSQRLRSLTLPSCQALPCVEALAGCLTDLHVKLLYPYEGNGTLQEEDHMPNEAAVRSITRLKHLTRLSIMAEGIDPWAFEEGLLLLLNNLPAGLLHLTVFMEDDNTLTALLAKDHFQELTVSEAHPAKILADFLEVLLESRPMPSRLPTLVLARFVCKESSSWRPALDLHDPALQPLRALLDRCDCVRLEELVVTTAAAVPAAVRRLGRPRCLSFTPQQTNGSGRLRLDLRGAAAAAGFHHLSAKPPPGASLHESAPVVRPPTSTGPSGLEDCPRSNSSSHTAPAAAAPSSSDSSRPAVTLPPVAVVGGAVLARLLSGGVTISLAPAPARVPPQQQQEDPAASGAAGSPSGISSSTDSVDTRRAEAEGGPPEPQNRLLLLRGPLMEQLFQGPADELSSWMHCLRQQAAAVAVAREADRRRLPYRTAQPDYNHCEEFLDYQVLPCALGCPGALVLCGKAEGALTAVVEVLRSGLAAQDPGGLTVEAMLLPRAEAALRSWSEGRFNSVRLEMWGGAGRAYLIPLREELQALWDIHVGSCGGDREAELGLMCGLMERAELLADLPGWDWWRFE